MRRTAKHEALLSKLQDTYPAIDFRRYRDLEYWHLKDFEQYLSKGLTAEEAYEWVKCNPYETNAIGGLIFPWGERP